MVALLLPQAAVLALPGNAAEQAGAVRSLVHESLLAFCNGDLLHAGRALLRGARGSYGLRDPNPNSNPNPNANPNQVRAAPSAWYSLTRSTRTPTSWWPHAYPYPYSCPYPYP